MLQTSWHVIFLIQMHSPVKFFFPAGLRNSMVCTTANSTESSKKGYPLGHKA